ncbi:MAG TPA: RnfABCDGE type electron transport complex subunit B [Casimicrobiaceae bacterium]|jgi:electron transport complex protein RnfB|nr:RnfABCDGE type electron transport complex subunit B [Casimicrobiaceae bacterium]
MDNGEAVLLVERIDALLPQTQCRRCGYDGCRPYAHAMAQGAAAINRCPPGGEETVVALSALLRVPMLPLDPACGDSEPLVVARIDEIACIGCTLCVAACPVDAIVGAAKLMHTVLASRCTGCGLCVPPCPVDCIALLPAGRAWTHADADLARSRFEEHAQRLEKKAAKRAADGTHSASPKDAARARRQAAISAALARARARRAARSAPRS